MSRRKEPTIPNELLNQLLAGGAASAAIEQGGLLGALKKALTERALNAEMDHHLADDDGAGNTRNGYGRKTVTTETGSMAIEVPRDRQASFDPQLIAKYGAHFRFRLCEGLLSEGNRPISNVSGAQKMPRHVAGARSLRLFCDGFVIHSHG